MVAKDERKQRDWAPSWTHRDDAPTTTHLSWWFTQDEALAVSLPRISHGEGFYLVLAFSFCIILRRGGGCFLCFLVTCNVVTLPSRAVLCEELLFMYPPSRDLHWLKIRSIRLKWHQRWFSDHWSSIIYQALDIQLNLNDSPVHHVSKIKNFTTRAHGWEDLEQVVPSTGTSESTLAQYSCQLEVHAQRSRFFENPGRLRVIQVTELWLTDAVEILTNRLLSSRLPGLEQLLLFDNLSSSSHVCM